MIFAQLTKHWRGTFGQCGIVSWFLGVARSLRVLAFRREHRELCALEVFRNYVAAPPNADPFHHLSHRDYLFRGLSPRQRVHCALAHYRFEEATFDRAWWQAVYRNGGLTLWQHNDGANRFMIRLEMAERANAEGDLMVALVANNVYLHRLSFAWLEGSMFGLDAPMLPFITRNQGRWTDSGQAFAAFEQAFPNNSPSFYCFAAMQGVAQALGMDQVVAVRCEKHVAYDPAEVRHFANAYETFWKILGGVEMDGPGYLIALPFYLKPLAEMPSKHRKRTAQRRENWRVIGESARLAIVRHLANAPLAVPQAAPLAEAAEA